MNAPHSSHQPLDPNLAIAQTITGGGAAILPSRCRVLGVRSLNDWFGSGIKSISRPFTDPPQQGANNFLVMSELARLRHAGRLRACLFVGGRPEVIGARQNEAIDPTATLAATRVHPLYHMSEKADYRRLCEMEKRCGA